MTSPDAMFSNAGSSKIMKFICVLSFLLSSSFILIAQNLTLNSLFSDNMVLQRNKPIFIWGKALAGTTVLVSFKQSSYTCNTNNNGDWMLSLPESEAGTNFNLTVSCQKETLRIANIAVGDVWIASGQSNMAYKMREGVLNADSEIKLANYPNIRYMEVSRTPFTSPQNEIPKAQWLVCTLENISNISAVAYFFAQKINVETKVPIGIIDASWGGSSIEAWMSNEAIGNLPHLPGPKINDEILKNYSLDAYSKINEGYADDLIRISKNSFEGLKKGAHLPDFNDKDWSEIKVPDWGNVTNQVFWLRKNVQINNVPDDSLILSLGGPATYINIYLNGKEVYTGNIGACKARIAPSNFKKGKNTIAVRLADTWWQPSISGKDEDIFLKDKSGKVNIPLAGMWKYSNKIEPQMPTLLQLNNVPSGLFNGMISPLLKFRIAGFIWYQGEQNSDEGISYQKLFPSLINDWRIRFQQGYLPFLYVQLANLGEPSELSERKGWPYLREAQDMALSLPYTGMATAIDIGNRYDIHPKDKKTVGYRLAANALKMCYAIPLACINPHYEYSRIQDDTVFVYFRDAKSLSTINKDAPKSFVIAGSDSVFFKAEATISGNTIILHSDKVKRPVAVRYAWAKNPVINLYNEANLPVLPFRTDNW